MVDDATWPKVAPAPDACSLSHVEAYFVDCQGQRIPNCNSKTESVDRAVFDRDRSIGGVCGADGDSNIIIWIGRSSRNAEPFQVDDDRSRDSRINVYRRSVRRG